MEKKKTKPNSYAIPFDISINFEVLDTPLSEAVFDSNNAIFSEYATGIYGEVKSGVEHKSVLHQFFRVLIIENKTIQKGFVAIDRFNAYRFSRTIIKHLRYMIYGQGYSQFHLEIGIHCPPHLMMACFDMLLELMPIIATNLSIETSKTQYGTKTQIVSRIVSNNCYKEWMVKTRMKTKSI